MKHIVLTGGGTAGHVTPNLALLPALQENGFTVSYIGSKNGIEKKLVQDAGIAYYEISTGKLRRYLSKENLTDAFRVVKGLADATALLKKLRPDIVFSKGGFVAVPVVLAAKLCGIDVVVHESDLTPGLANRIAIPFAKTVCTTFAQTAKEIPKQKGVYTGTPIRKSLFAGNRETGLQMCGFDGKKPVVMMMGGSSGAKKLNACLREALDELTADFSLIHLCGKGNVDAAYAGRKDYTQIEYASAELPHLMAAADVVISRAGSNAISEFLALGKPQLLIPLSAKASRGDQLLNAAYFEKQGFAAVLQESEMTKESLPRALRDVYEHREQYLAAMRRETVQDGVAAVMQQILKVSDKN